MKNIAQHIVYCGPETPLQFFGPQSPPLGFCRWQYSSVTFGTVIFQFLAARYYCKKIMCRNGWVIIFWRMKGKRNRGGCLATSYHIPRDVQFRIQSNPDSSDFPSLTVWNTHIFLGTEMPLSYSLKYQFHFLSFWPFHTQNSRHLRNFLNIIVANLWTGGISSKE